MLSVVDVQLPAQVVLNGSPSLPVVKVTILVLKLGLVALKHRVVASLLGVDRDREVGQRFIS